LGRGQCGAQPFHGRDPVDPDCIRARRGPGGENTEAGEHGRQLSDGRVTDGFLLARFHVRKSRTDHRQIRDPSS